MVGKTIARIQADVGEEAVVETSYQEADTEISKTSMDVETMMVSAKDLLAEALVVVVMKIVKISITVSMMAVNAVDFLTDLLVQEVVSIVGKKDTW